MIIEWKGIKHFIAGGVIVISRSHMLTHTTDIKMYTCLKIELINGNCKSVKILLEDIKKL